MKCMRNKNKNKNVSLKYIIIQVLSKIQLNNLKTYVYNLNISKKRFIALKTKVSEN